MPASATPDELGQGIDFVKHRIAFLRMQIGEKDVYSATAGECSWRSMLEHMAKAWSGMVHVQSHSAGAISVEEENNVVVPGK